MEHREIISNCGLRIANFWVVILQFPNSNFSLLILIPHYFLVPCTLYLVPFRFRFLTVNHSPHGPREINFELGHTTKLISNRSAAALSLMPMASDIPMGREVERPKGARIFLSSVSKDRNTSTTRSATSSGSRRL